MKASVHTSVAGSLFPILGLLVLAFLPCQLKAQIDRGQATRTVVGLSGARVPNATVLLANDATNVSIATKTTPTGNYTFGNMHPVTYTVQAESTGFEKYVVHRVYVRMQQVATVDVHLATGNVELRTLVRR